MHANRPAKRPSVIQELRVKRGWTAIELALRAGVSPSTVQQAEGGYAPQRALSLIAAALGVDPDIIRPRVP